MFVKSESDAAVFISMAPYFFNESGHYRAYHSELLKAMGGLGIESFTFIPHCCKSVDLDGRWVRHFRYSGNRIMRMFLRFLDYNRLIRLMPDRTKILFFESYSLLDLLSIALVFFLSSKDKIQLWQVVRDGLEWNRKKRRIHLTIYRMFFWMLGPNYKTFTDSARIIDSLQQDLGIPITLLPIPHSKEFLGQLTTFSFERVIRLWLPGTPRFDKGVKEIIKLFSAEDDHLKNMELRIEPLEGLISPMIKWMKPNLSREEYLKNLGEIDALLLPYDPTLYVSRTSGPFVEAICAGKIVFTKKGNWLAYELEKHDLTECILDWDSVSIASEITRVFRDKRIREKLYKMQEKYCKFHTSNSFSKILKESLNAQPRCRHSS